jgi:hypothetical protein
MGKKRANWRTDSNDLIEGDSFFVAGSFMDGFHEWLDSPEGQQSIEAHDMVFDALEDADVDPGQRKIVWADGQRLSIEQSAERVHASYPDMPLDLIERHVFGWLENCAPERYSEQEMEELDRLIQPWIDDYERALHETEK